MAVEMLAEVVFIEEEGADGALARYVCVLLRMVEQLFVLQATQVADWTFVEGRSVIILALQCS